MTVNKIRELIEKKQFSKAEAELKALTNNGDTASLAHYLLGCICANYDNPRRSVDHAKFHFTKVIRAEDHMDDAFLQLARIESDIPHKLRILRNGCKLYPKSEPLNFSLLRWTPFAERAEQYTAMLDNSIVSRRAAGTMILTHMSLEDFDAAHKILPSIAPRGQDQEMVLKLLESICTIESNDIKDAETGLNSLRENDLARSLAYMQFFALIRCYLLLDDLSSATKILSEIPDEPHFIEIADEEFEGLDRYLYTYALSVLSQLIKGNIDKHSKAKARGLRGLIDCDYSLVSDRPSTVVLADLKQAMKDMPRNSRLRKEIAQIALYDADYLTAHDMTMKYISVSGYDARRDAISSCNFSYIVKSSDIDFETIAEYVVAGLRSSPHLYREIVIYGLGSQMIDRLFQLKRYERIVEIADTLGLTKGQLCDAYFAFAYSHSECEKIEMARHFYEWAIDYDSSNCAAHNNLGVIYNREGNLKKAKERFEWAIKLDENKELYKNNLGNIAIKEASVRELPLAAILSKKAIVEIWSARERDSYTLNALGIIQKRLSLNAAHAKKLLTELIGKGFCLEIDKKYHKYTGSVHRINPYLEERLPDLESEITLTVDLMAVSERITPQALSAIGYDESLSACINNVASVDMRELLKRDLREAALSLLSRSHKTTLILSGSIIEAVLLDKVNAKGLNSYKIEERSKAVSRMDLHDLLHVAQSEKLIDDQLYHLAQALRGFRNLIHPGVEKRKSAITVNEQNARIAWDITRKLLVEM